MSRNVVLMDMDQTTVAFRKGVVDGLVRLKLIQPGDIDPNNIETDKTGKVIPEEIRQQYLEMVGSKDFFLNLKPMPGAVKGIIELHEKLQSHEIGLEFLSAPWDSEHCIPEKIEWLRQTWPEHDFYKTAHLLKDKAEVEGLLLVDDWSTVSAEGTPSWEQVIFDGANNRHIETDMRMMDWTTPEIDKVVQWALAKR